MCSHYSYTFKLGKQFHLHFCTWPSILQGLKNQPQHVLLYQLLESKDTLMWSALPLTGFILYLAVHLRARPKQWT